MTAPEFQNGDALMLIDLQNDFCPGGELPIEGGDEVVEAVNPWIEGAQAAGIPVFASRDWHPQEHISFKAQGGEWPPHCVQDTDGAAFHPRLRLPTDTVKVTKGVRFDQDQNSAFDQTGLADELRRRGVSRIWIAGLAQDVCVEATALDARQEGFAVMLFARGTRPVSAEGGRKALERMREAGVEVVTGG